MTQEPEPDDEGLLVSGVIDRTREFVVVEFPGMDKEQGRMVFTRQAIKCIHLHAVSVMYQCTGLPYSGYVQNGARAVEALGGMSRVSAAIQRCAALSWSCFLHRLMDKYRQIAYNVCCNDCLVRPRCFGAGRDTIR